MTKKLLARDLVRFIKEGFVKHERDKFQSRDLEFGGDYFYASEAGGCQLRPYLRRTGIPGEPHGQFRYTDLAERGGDIESTIIKSLCDGSGFRGVSQARQTRTDTRAGQRFTIVGRADFVLEGPGASGPAWYYIECKSTSSDRFDELRSLNDVLTKRLDYINQCTTYHWLFDVRSIYLLLVDRGDSRFRAFEIKRDKEREERLLTELAETEKAIQKKDPPNPKPGYYCYTCPYIQNNCPAWQQEAPA